MPSYLFKRILLLIPIFFGITVVTFGVVQLAPGSPVALKLQAMRGVLSSQGITKEVMEETKKLYGLDQPFHRQYFVWLKRLVRLDFGHSFKDHRPVLDKIKEALPVTLLLNLCSLFLIYLISVPLGIYSALRPESRFEKGMMLCFFFLYSLPSFWVALLLIVYLGGGDYLNLFPISGLVSEGFETLSLWGKAGNLLWHLVLPVAVLTYGEFAFLSRFQRAQMMEVIHQDYIRTARAKGLSEFQVVFKHAFRNALIPLITLSAAILPSLIGGSVIVEQIFAIPGMGRLGFEAVVSRDYPTVMAITSLGAFLTLVGILLADLLYVVADPRISFRRIKG